MYIYAGGFDCAAYIRNRKGSGSAPKEIVDACIDKVKSKDDQLSCLYWFMHCMCCDYGYCTEHQKSKGWRKGYCPKEGLTEEGIMQYVSKYWWLGLVAIGAIILLRR